METTISAESTTGRIVEQAAFSPSIRTYILVLVALFFAITLIGIPLLLIWFLGLGQYVSKRYFENLECQLTTRHLEYRKGVFFKVEKTIPLENIQDLTFVTNPILNYFDLKILKIETAGNSGAQGADMKLIGIIGAEDFKRKVLIQREQLKSGDHRSQEVAASEGETLAVLKEIRDLLKSMKTEG